MNRRRFVKGALTLAALLGLRRLSAAEAVPESTSATPDADYRQVVRVVSVSAEDFPAFHQKTCLALAKLNARRCGWLGRGRILLVWYSAQSERDAAGRKTWRFQLRYYVTDGPDWNHVRGADGRWKRIAPEPYAHSEDVRL